MSVADCVSKLASTEVCEQFSPGQSILGLLLVALIVGVLIWASYPFERPRRSGGHCPYCGVRRNPGMTACWACGRSTDDNDYGSAT